MLTKQTSELSDKPSLKEDSASWMFPSSSFASTSVVFIQAPFAQSRRVGLSLSPLFSLSSED